MADIVALESEPNLTLIGGATQFWRDAALGAGWADALARHARGRTLLIGNPSTEVLGLVAERADEVHVLTRGVPDAAAVARADRRATVWCGDPADLGERTDPFDSVLAADAAVALPLESDARDWQQVIADIRALGTSAATVVQVVENDIGTHRISSLRNPRSAETDADWDPTATWDESRPRSLAQVQQAFSGAAVYCLWPSPEQVTLLADGQIDPNLHTALAFDAAAGSLHGPDPAWLITAFARGGHLVDVAPAWLVVHNNRTEVPAVERVRDGQLVPGPFEALPGRSALDVFAELAAAENLPEIRRLVAAWAEATAGSSGTTTVDANFGLCTAERDDAGWRVTPTVTIDGMPTTDAQWAALGKLVAMVRDRAWRSPWPSTTGYPRMLNHLGIMAGLHTVSTARADKLIATPPPSEDYLGTDHQQLVAKLEQQRRTIDTLQSKVAWVQLHLNNALERDAIKPVAVLRASGNRASRVGRETLRTVRGMARRIIG